MVIFILFNEQKVRILGELFGNRTYTKPSNYYLGLSTTTINADGSGITEISGGNYDRVKIANDISQWSEVADNNTIANKNKITFKEMTDNWNTYSDNGKLYAFLSDSQTDTTGHLISYCEISYKFLQTGSTLFIPVNGLKFRMD